MTINERIRFLRKENGWSQQELAEKMGYKSKVAISRFESGNRELSKSNIYAFAHILNVTPAYLINGVDDEEKPVTKKQQALIDSVSLLTESECDEMISIIISVLKNREEK